MIMITNSPACGSLLNTAGRPFTAKAGDFEMSFKDRNKI